MHEYRKVTRMRNILSERRCHSSPRLPLGIGKGCNPHIFAGPQRETLGACRCALARGPKGADRRETCRGSAAPCEEDEEAKEAAPLRACLHNNRTHAITRQNCGATCVRACVRRAGRRQTGDGGWRGEGLNGPGLVARCEKRTCNACAVASRALPRSLGRRKSVGDLRARAAATQLQ